MSSTMIISMDNWCVRWHICSMTRIFLNTGYLWERHINTNVFSVNIWVPSWWSSFTYWNNFNHLILKTYLELKSCWIIFGLLKCKNIFLLWARQRTTLTLYLTTFLEAWMKSNTTSGNLRKVTITSNEGSNEKRKREIQFKWKIVSRNSGFSINLFNFPQYFFF